MTTVSNPIRPTILVCALGLLATFSATAEIVLIEGGAVESTYVYAHPSLQSIVFFSPQTRDMAIFPPSPYFVNYPPLLLRAPSPYAVDYPPVVYQSGINATARLSNRDVTSYNIGRAHAFSQEYYYPETYSSYPGSAPVLYTGPYGVMPYYPPTTGTGGFNQPVRPSNRDNTSYSIERAHRFSMDAYKSPK